MTLIASGIEKVTAFELPTGIWGSGQYLAQPNLALVKWHSQHSDKPHQVYVNGRFAGVTVDNCQRQMVVQFPLLPESAVRIEVFAVEPEHAHIDFAGELPYRPGSSGQIRLTMLRSQLLPMGATIRIYCDNGTGQIDYDKPVNDLPLPVWPSRLDKAGFAMSRFGLNDFGYDSAAAVGFAKGSFGHGTFGMDADTIELLSPPLNAGVYKFAVVVTDNKGIESGPSETEPVTVTPAARTAEELKIVSFDKHTNNLILGVRYG